MKLGILCSTDESAIQITDVTKRLENVSMFSFQGDFSVYYMQIQAAIAWTPETPQPQLIGRSSPRL